MRVQIDIGEIVMEGVELTEAQVFELRLAIEKQLSGSMATWESHGASNSQHERLVAKVGPSNSPHNLASQITSTIQSAATPTLDPQPQSLSTHDL